MLDLTTATEDCRPFVVEARLGVVKVVTVPWAVPRARPFEEALDRISPDSHDPARRVQRRPSLVAAWLNNRT